MSRLLTSPTRTNPRIHEGGARDFVTSDYVLVDTLGVSVASHATTAHTKSATYTEVIASTSGRVTMLRVLVASAGAANAVNSAGLLDIAVGASSSEVVLVANLNCGGLSSSAVGSFNVFWLPVSLPAGTRISANYQSAIIAQTLSVTVDAYVGTNRTATLIDTIGANTTTSRGVTTAMGLSSAEGAWQEIVSASAHHYSGIFMGIGLAADATWVSGVHNVDIGFGANPNEVEVLANMSFSSNTNEILSFTRPQVPRKVDIPEGSRICARISSNQAAAQSADVILYGVA